MLRYDKLIIPTSSLASTLSESLQQYADWRGCAIILDERKEYYRGHADCIRMNRGNPVLWLSQVLYFLTFSLLLKLIGLYSVPRLSGTVSH